MENPFNRIYRSCEYENANKLPLKGFPFILDVEPTNHCNLRCKMCQQNIMKRTKGFMDFSIFKKTVDECREHSAAVRLIRFGEHFLHPKIFEFIEYAREKGVLIHLTTNGLLLDRDKIGKLLDTGLDSIIFSFQGAGREGYEEMRKNNQYDLLVDNIKQLVGMRNSKKKEKPWVHVSSTMTGETEEEIRQFKLYWEGIADSVGVGKTNFAIVDKEDYHRAIEEYLPRETVVRKYRPCTEVYQKLSVNWNGDVTACCGDHDNYLIVGSVKDKTLKEIWEGRKMNNIRRILDGMGMAELPLCQDCYLAYDEF